MAEARFSPGVLVVAILFAQTAIFLPFLVISNGRRGAIENYHQNYKPPYRWVGVGRGIEEVDRVDSDNRICGILYQSQHAAPGPGDVLGRPVEKWSSYGYGFSSFDVSRAVAIDTINKNCY